GEASSRICSRLQYAGDMQVPGAGAAGVLSPKQAYFSLQSKWAVGKARGGRISRAIRNRRATQPPAHFHRNPPGRGQLAVFRRCSLLTYRFRYARRSRLEKQPTDLRRKACLFRGQDTNVISLDNMHPSEIPVPKIPLLMRSIWKGAIS